MKTKSQLSSTYQMVLDVNLCVCGGGGSGVEARKSSKVKTPKERHKNILFQIWLPKYPLNMKQTVLESQIVVVVIKYDCTVMLLPRRFTCFSLIFQNVPFL